MRARLTFSSTPQCLRWADHSLTAKYQQAGLDLDRFLSESIRRRTPFSMRQRPRPPAYLFRGNSMGRWLAGGGYDKIAEKLFNELRCDRLLLEYDSPRAGDFAPLRFVPKNKIVVLGLITKHGELETADELVRRVDGPRATFRSSNWRSAPNAVLHPRAAEIR